MATPNATSAPTATAEREGVRVGNVVELLTRPVGGPLALPDSPSVKWLNATLDEDQVKTLLATVAQKATMDELAVFLWAARRRGLDPFLKQVHFVKRRRSERDPATGEWKYVEYGVHQTGIDGLRVIANRAKDEAGTKLLEGIERGPIKDETGRLVGGWAKVYRHGWTVPAHVQLDYMEYEARNTKGDTEGLWKTKPQTMIEKCSEAAALRMAFPEDLGDLLIHEEMDAAEHVVRVNGPEQPPVTSASVPRAEGLVIEGTAVRVEETAPATPAPAPAAPAQAPAPSPAPTQGALDWEPEPDPKDPLVIEKRALLKQLADLVAKFKTPPPPDRFRALTVALLGRPCDDVASIPLTVDPPALHDLVKLLRDMSVSAPGAKERYLEALAKGVAK